MFTRMGKSIFRALGDSALYTPVTGTPVDCLAMPDHDVLIQAQGYEAGVTTLGTTVSAMVVDVGTPVKGATFLIDGTTYTVQRIEENDNIFVRVVVK